MCGIVGAVAERNVVPILMDGLRRLEYRGYDSAGIAVQQNGELQRVRRQGKVADLQALLDADPLSGVSGIAHTRWATHGVPSDKNAHPHLSNDSIAVVHNGIIENHEALRADLLKHGYEFESETDSEVIAHHVHFHLQQTGNLLDAVRATVAELEGAYALVVMSDAEPGRLVLARRGCPVVVGLGSDENFVASDVTALLPVTRRFLFLEEGDIADITPSGVEVFDANGSRVEREVTKSELSADAVERGEYRHYMLKEIHEQSQAVADTLAERIADGKVLDAAFGPTAPEILERTEAVHIVACGTSYHAGLIARYWIEEYCRIPCSVEIASEYRYRKGVVPDRCLFISISQSGETADTLAAARAAQKKGYLATLAICNVPESSLVRESALVLMTKAGPEIGVASTKAFTTQLAALGLLTIVLARYRGMEAVDERRLTELLTDLPTMIEQVLTLDEPIQKLSAAFADHHNALFLGRGAQNPIAMEGALKLKEISYIHAEGYPAGEMKHCPIALVDEEMPIIAIVTKDPWYEKMISQIEQTKARGGKVIAVVSEGDTLIESMADHVLWVPETPWMLSPAINVIPLQMLAYHIATLRGLDVDQPRNLAKSVTVE